uniref:Uncharacterized protein n=1 Tax=uncultured bacterium A1Q1_fos_1025 TaxID=1256537 RepID=L7VVS8_9BACT|nr:hypothetical protein [uncultured bacterium A1Q1_fos_1025]
MTRPGRALTWAAPCLQVHMHVGERGAGVTTTRPASPWPPRVPRPG